MGIEDKVEHLKAKHKPKLEAREIRDLDEKESLEARDLLWKAALALKPALSAPAGFLVTFIYGAGPDSYIFKSIPSVDYVPEAVGQMACKEMTASAMRVYGHEMKEGKKN